MEIGGVHLLHALFSQRQMNMFQRASLPGGTFAVQISLKQYFENRHEVGDEATQAAIIRAFKRAVDTLNCGPTKPYVLELQSYTNLFKAHVEKIYAFLLANAKEWWCDIEDEVEAMVQALMAEQLVVSRQRKLALLAA